MGIRDDLLLESLSGRSHDAASFEKQRILAAFSLFRLQPWLRNIAHSELP